MTLQRAGHVVVGQTVVQKWEQAPRSRRARSSKRAAPAPQAELPPRWDPFGWVANWSPRMARTAAMVSVVGDRPGNAAISALGRTLGDVWRRPQALAYNLGIPVQEVRAGSLNREDRPDVLILARSIMPPLPGGPLILLGVDTPQNQARVLAHELGHILFPLLEHGTDEGEQLMDTFAEGWCGQ